ncbi:unnamed protein product [Amoebophrya sp. A120]|nr:unnamed protein product [Amoebophrya sp. A120]|eukprot:GSA120T00010947001.1
MKKWDISLDGSGSNSASTDLEEAQRWVADVGTSASPSCEDGEDNSLSAPSRDATLASSLSASLAAPLSLPPVVGTTTTTSGPRISTGPAPAIGVDDLPGGNPLRKSTSFSTDCTLEHSVPAMISRRDSVQSLCEKSRSVVPDLHKRAGGATQHVVVNVPGAVGGGGASNLLPNAASTTTAVGGGGADPSPTDTLGNSNKTPFLDLVPGLVMHDFYHTPGEEEDADWERFLENLQECVYAYDALATHDRLPHFESEGLDPVPLWELIHRLEKDPVNDPQIPQITPQLLHFAWEGLKKDQKTIQNAFHGRFKHIRGDAPLPKLGYVKARIGRGERVTNSLFVPRKHQVSTSQFTETLKTKWNLQKPSMYIKLDFGTKHPCALSTSELLQEPAFKSIVEQASFQLNKKGGVMRKRGGPQDYMALERTASCEALEEEKEHALQVAQEVDEVLFSRLVNVLTAVLQAAYMSNIWVVVDRTDSTKSSPTSELLLELALQKCDKLPVVLCLDSLQRYQQFRPSFRVNEQLLHLFKLSSQAKPFDEPTECHGVHTLYSPSDFHEWKSYHFRVPHEEYAPSHFGTKEEYETWLAEGDRRLPRKPEDAMVQTDEHHVMMRTHDGRRLVTPQNKWLYHYRQYLYGSATHYCLFESATDSSLPLEKFGGEGRIFAHGGNLSFDRMVDWISRGKPTVILLNTGGVAQSFGSLHYWCVTKKAHLENIQPNECARRQLILEKVSLVSREPWARKFGLPQIMMMQELEKRAPDVMRKSVIVVDGLREGPEAVVEKLTGCFAQSSLGLPELGLGTAEEDVVIEAWKMHMTLIKNAKVFRKWADLLYLLQLMLGWFGAFFSVYFSVHVARECAGDQHKCGDSDFLYLALTNFLLIIPIVAGALGAYVSHRRYLQKWGATYTAAGQIVSEIYKFRCHVNEYNPFSDEAKTGESAGVDPDHVSAELVDSATEGLKGDHLKADDGSRAPRKVFVINVQSIYAAVLESLSDDAMKESWTGKSCVADIGNQEFKATLREHVPRTVLRSGFYYAKNGNREDIQFKMPKHLAKQLRKLEGLAHIPGMGNALSHVTRTIQRTSKGPSEPETGDMEIHHCENDNFIEEDDFVSPMTIETYVEYRLRVLLTLFQKQAPPLSQRLSTLETLGILVTASGTFLAAILQQHWVVFTVTLATSISNISHYMCLSPRLSSLNQAIRDLRSVMILMDSLSVVEKRTVEKRTYAVSTVENAVLGTITAWTGNAGRAPGDTHEDASSKGTAPEGS